MSRDNAIATRPRIVIGSGDANKLAALVCEFSIRKYCPDAEVIHTYHRPFLKDGNRKVHRDRWEDPCEWINLPKPTGTLFSLCRVMVPEICGFEGRAIYLDADMIVFTDICELWDIPMDGASVIQIELPHPRPSSVQVIDCGAMREHTLKSLRSRNIRYTDCLKGKYLGDKIVRKIPMAWNMLDQKNAGTKLLHYTRMPTQPWIKNGHALGGVWFDLLAEAVKTGFLTREQVVAGVRDTKDPWVAACYPQPHCLEELDKRL